MKRFLILTSLVIQGCSFVYGQQIAQYSQYSRNQSLLNPGAVGVYDFTDITLNGRWQWVGFGDNNEPRTAMASFSTLIGSRKKPMYNPALRTSPGIIPNAKIDVGKNKHGIGGQVLVDQYGAFRRINLSGAYAIHLPVSDQYNISFGTRIGLSSNTFMPERAVVLNPLDPTMAYNGGDLEYDAYVSQSGSKYIMDMAAGLYFYSEDLYLGIASDHLTKDFVEFGSGTANFNTQMHFNFIAGYRIKVNDDLDLIPSVLLKNMRPAPLSVDLTLNAEYKKWLWLGCSYRYKDAVIAMFGMNISEQWKFGYSYDFSVSKMNKVTSGGHELVLGIMLK